MSVRGVLFWLNVIGLAGLAAYLAWATLSPRRVRREGERTPPNQTPFLPDEDLESRRLERVLGWGLFFAAIVAVSLPLYWLREPTRQDESEDYFDEGAVERGETFFANAQSPAYDAVMSLQCANCHGLDGSGGSTTKVIDPDGPDGDAVPVRYTWKAPPLNTVLLRFSEDEVAEIITYGRPGTPMQAFGVEGGGAENTQTILDLVAYLRSIQLSPAEARDQATAALAAARTADGEQVAAAEDALTAAQEAFDEAAGALRDALGEPGADDTALQAACEEIEEQVDEDPDQVDRDQRRACGDFVDAGTALDEAQDGLEWARQWATLREGVSDGQLLFELYCARCHTEGWSVFDPTEPGGTEILGLAGGGGGIYGGIGFNLRDGSEVRRFGPGGKGTPNFEDMVTFVSEGSEANVQYGDGGRGSGHMPGFGDMLTREQIELIVEYERDHIDDTTYVPEASP